MKIKNRFKCNGFSLIEVVFVVAILAILAMILVPTINKYTLEASKAKDQANVRTIYTKALLMNSKLPNSTSVKYRKKTVEQYFIDNGTNGVSVIIDDRGSVSSIEYIGDSGSFSFNGRIMREVDE